MQQVCGGIINLPLDRPSENTHKVHNYKHTAQKVKRACFTARGQHRSPRLRAFLVQGFLLPNWVRPAPPPPLPRPHRTQISEGCSPSAQGGTVLRG